MPRDCTAQPYGPTGCTVPLVSGGSNTTHNFTQTQSHAMARKSRNNTANSGSAAGRPKSSSKTGKGSGNNWANSGGSAPVAVGTTTNKRSPRYLASGGVRVANTEFIQDLAVDTQLALDINPVAGSTFAWLGRIASSYEIFRIHKLVFRYTPICSSSTTGVVVMAFDYDASDAPPTSKQAMSAYDGSTRGNVWNSLTCSFKAPDSWYFVGQQGSTTVNPASTDIKMYDAAKFYVSVFNATSGTVGEISVDYDIEFARPAFDAPATGTETVQFSGGNYSNLLGTPSYYGTMSNIISPAGSGAFQIRFVVNGTFLIEVFGSATTPSAAAPLFQSATQTDPGSTTSTVVGLLDQLTSGWTAAGSFYSSLMLYNVVVVSGTVLTIPLIAAATAGYLNRLRITPSLKSLT